MIINLEFTFHDNQPPIHLYIKWDMRTNHSMGQYTTIHYWLDQMDHNFHKAPKR